MKKYYAALLIALMLCAGAASAGERGKISVALSLGAFTPTSSDARDTYGSTWTRISLTSFEPNKPTHWRFITEGGQYKLDGTQSAKLVPITFGAEKGLGNHPKAQPYLSLKAGPYFGRITNDATSFDENHTGLNMNAAYGIVFNKRFYTEARYDWFSPFGGSNFSGFSISAGVRLFDIRL